jgi:CRP-like cAMP-binding protein
MDLLRRIFGSRDPAPLPENDLTGKDPADRGSLLSLTVLFGRRRLKVEIAGPARTVDAERMLAAGSIPQPRGHASTGLHWSPPLRTFDDFQEPRASSSYSQARPGRTAAEEPRQPGSASADFWDVLDPTEREALRSVACCRTFAAGARIMEEGERADHVMVILGGRAKICVDENGRERVLAIRGLGQLVGERGALQVSVRSASVIALDMIWALVVETKDFATFISAHPRVLDIVQSQLYQRAEESAGYEHDRGPDGWPAGTVGSMSVAGTAGRARQRPQPLNGENCTVFLTDVVEFGARTRTDSDRLLIREALFRMTQAAMQGMPDARPEDRGDGFLTVVPPGISTARVIDQLLRELPVALGQHNRTERESARFKLRLAINVGPVVSDAAGVSSEAIIVAARLVEAPSFKQAIAESTASLGVIASPFVYEAVIRHGADPREVASYSQVPVEVKESATTAWMKLFNAPIPSPQDTAHEPYLGTLTRSARSLDLTARTGALSGRWLP